MLSFFLAPRRFQKCMTSGMKPSWVLSDAEKMERMEKKRNKGNNCVNNLEEDIKNKSTVCFDIMAKPHQHGFKLDEETLVKEWIYAQESTRHTIPVTSEIMAEILTMTHTGGKMSSKNIIELFKCLYFRVVTFAGFVDEFKVRNYARVRNSCPNCDDFFIHLLSNLFRHYPTGIESSFWPRIWTCCPTSVFSVASTLRTAKVISRPSGHSWARARSRHRGRRLWSWSRSSAIPGPWTKNTAEPTTGR